MIGNKNSTPKYLYAFLVALVLHVAIFALVKSDIENLEFLNHLSELTKNLNQPIKLNDIKIVSPAEVEQMKKVGIRGGKKIDRPDLGPLLPPVTRPVPPSPEKTRGQPQPNLSLQNLAPNLPKPSPVQKEASTANKVPNLLGRELAPQASNDNGGHFYFNYNKSSQKVIPRSSEQEILKTEATKGYTAPRNKATDKISNFEIRYERPEGVSEDELNSDEKAYYSFYVRSYKNYFAKVYSTYEKVVLERPGLSRVFDGRHLLIGKIDYDKNGNIVTVKILKSSENDDLAFFFEETLKQLDQPNPPKVFTKNRDQFSIYYQIQIN